MIPQTLIDSFNAAVERAHEQLIPLQDEAYKRGKQDGAKEADAEVVRLRAVVDKLPKTADGVPVVPGRDVWICLHGQFVQMLVTGTLIDARVELTFHSKHRTIEQVYNCYSSQEAAEAAAKAES